VLLRKDYLGDQIKKNVIARVCGQYGGKERCVQCFDGET
jgi:hypothetical protein